MACIPLYSEGRNVRKFEGHRRKETSMTEGFPVAQKRSMHHFLFFTTILWGRNGFSHSTCGVWGHREGSEPPSLVAHERGCGGLKAGVFHPDFWAQQCGQSPPTGMCPLWAWVCALDLEGGCGLRGRQVMAMKTHQLIPLFWNDLASFS